MFEMAIHSTIPVIGVTTDDVVYLADVLHGWTGLKAVELTGKTHIPVGKNIYYTFDLDNVTIALYNKFKQNEHTLVVINPDKSSPLVFDAGPLPVPLDMLKAKIAEIAQTPVELLLPVLKGLSLKSVEEILLLTQAQYGDTLPPHVKHVRTMMKGLEHGLTQVDTEYDFYSKPEKLAAWLDLNSSYFLDPNTPPKLVPRGLMFEGYPGTGKSMAAKAIANHFNIPLYRLDIAVSITKYQGETENRIARTLASLEQEAPAVLLIDEAEKIFASHSSGDTGVVTRVLSQLLWWLAEHRSKIITVMTTNDLSNIPPELYRSGRIDQVMKIPRMGLQEAHVFAIRVYESVLSHKPPVKVSALLKDALKNKEGAEFAHSDVAELVYFLIKKNKWLVD